ncbi:hypothetical protein FCJ61_33195 [Burkholderia metallica]|nr:hypothetical protein [Burkholderia metallica]
MSACTKFVRMRSKLKCMHGSRRQRTHARAAAAATVPGGAGALTRWSGEPLRSGDCRAQPACDSANHDAPQ